jgi:hypothetical protein
MSTVYWERPYSKGPEITCNPKLLIQMQTTALLIASYLKTDDEPVREAFRKSLLTSFVNVEEKRQRLPYKDLKSRVDNLDQNKEISHEILANYGWCCGYLVTWNDKNVLEAKSRF